MFQRTWDEARDCLGGCVGVWSTEGKQQRGGRRFLFLPQVLELQHAGSLQRFSQRLNPVLSLIGAASIGSRPRTADLGFWGTGRPMFSPALGVLSLHVPSRP
jgi:hypothetical protein